MKTRNKIFIGSGVIFLIMLIAGYSFVSAHGPWCDSGRGFHPRSHCKRVHSGFQSKEMADFMLWRMDKKAEELNLTDTQRVKYEALKSNLKTHLSEGISEHQRFIEQFHTEMVKEDPNVPFLIESIKAKINKISGFMNNNLDLLIEFYETLDDTQKHMIIDEIKERMEYHHS
jgi:hypothetical protein